MKKSVHSVAVMVNGVIRDYRWTKEAVTRCDYIIAVDGGSNHLFAMDVVPDLVIGDLDSIDPAAQKSFEQKGCSFKTFPQAKDQSDLQLALEYAASLKPESIRLFGALGKRFDHTYGNVLLLNRMDHLDISVVIEDEIHEIHLITARTEYLNRQGDILSLFSLTDQTTGVRTTGMAYPLCRETLYLGDTRGLSNVINDPEASISLETGKLLAIRIKHSDAI